MQRKRCSTLFCKPLMNVIDMHHLSHETHESYMYFFLCPDKLLLVLGDHGSGIIWIQNAKLWKIVKNGPELENCSHFSVNNGLWTQFEIFFNFSPNFCHIQWFFLKKNMILVCASKYGKNVGKNAENSCSKLRSIHFSDLFRACIRKPDNFQNYPT